MDAQNKTSIFLAVYFGHAYEHQYFVLPAYDCIKHYTSELNQTKIHKLHYLHWIDSDNLL